ncbi:hypothetical protein AeNC1_016273 [Aphanomyces euteiches]|nr:hypothetical protein AeNC1_016273 [Aphanomyces euteiches]
MIPDGEPVGILKDMIKEKNKNTITCDAKDLELYNVDGLAQDKEEQILYNGTSIDMPKCSLNNFSGSTTKLATRFSLSNYPQLSVSSVGRIHVLVVVPEGARSSTGDDAFLQKVEVAIERQFKKQKTRECVAFAGISTAKVNKVMKGLNVMVVSGKEPDRPKAKQVCAFEWDSTRREDEQIAEYSQYLRGQLNATLKQMGLCLLSARQFPGVLAIEDARFEFDLNGTTDVLVLDDLGDDMAENVRYLNGLRLVIDLKKDLKDDYSRKENQALAELIAANVKTPEQSPVVLLTDLGQKLVFLWLSSDSTIRKCVLKKPTNAFYFIRSILSTSNRLKMPNPFTTPRVRFPPKGNINVLFPVGEGSDIGDMIERCQLMKSEIHPLDWSMEREIGRKLVQTIPANWGT